MLKALGCSKYRQSTQRYQKVHLDLKQKNEGIRKAQETLYTIVHRVYQKVVGDGPEVPIEEKIKKVDDTISKVQARVQELQLNIDVGYINNTLIVNYYILF